jgi:serine/threonine protein kinase/tetratricopeptide (TPR) repeat protein
MLTTTDSTSQGGTPCCDDLQARLQARLDGCYTLERVLGRGGMATVFLARDLKHKRLVAFKVLRDEIAATLGADHFHREIEIAARLQHPHILTVLDSGEAGGLLWFTMPYVEGQTLRQRLRQEQQIEVEDAIRIAREVAGALDYAHEQGVVHRDVKPENILLTRRDEVLVADFGIARALGGDEVLTQAGIALGTPIYMSPEQASGCTVDERSDIYSLGCVLYEMLVGRPPHTGPTAQAILAKRIAEPPLSVQAVRSSVPSSIDQAIQRALAPIATDRFPTARAFARALQPPVARSVPTVVTPPAATPAQAAEIPSMSRSPSPAAVRRRPSHVPTALVMLALGFTIGAGALFAWRFTHPSAEYDGPKRLAVLPFENLGDSVDAYFADGITDELRSSLATVPGLEVVASRSSNQYRRTTKPLSEIARELGADYLLVGTIRWQRADGGPSRVRVSPELIKVGPGSVPMTTWAQPFEAARTDVFQVQVDIAARVTQSLPGSWTELARPPPRRPTMNTDAYDYYLRGNEYYDRETMADVQLSIQLYRRALTFDSAFALAWARLARAEAFVYWFAGDRSTAQLARVEESARKALSLAPDLPEAHIAMGYYHYWGHRDYSAALGEFASAAKSEPNNAEVADVVGLVLRRRGEWDEAVANFRRAAALDPRSVEYLFDLAHTYFLMRRYPDAERALGRAAALAPDSPNIYALRIATSVNAEGNLDKPRRLMREALTRVDFDRFGSTRLFGDCFELIASDDEYQGELARLTPAAFNGVALLYFEFKASVYRRRADSSKARAYGDSARIEGLATIQRHEGDVFSYSIVALENAYRGRGAEAVEAGKQALKVLPQSKDAVLAPQAHIALAEVYMVLGDTTGALVQLRAALSVPSYLSAGRLRADPFWAALAATPGFKRVMGQR